MIINGYKYDDASIVGIELNANIIKITFQKWWFADKTFEEINFVSNTEALKIYTELFNNWQKNGMKPLFVWTTRSVELPEGVEFV